jgi:hypothetical protein
MTFGFGAAIAVIPNVAATERAAIVISRRVITVGSLKVEDYRVEVGFCQNGQSLSPFEPRF